MLKIIFGLLLIVFSEFTIQEARAQTYSFDIQKDGLYEFSLAVFKGVLHKDFVMSPDFVADDRKFTLSLKDKTPAEVLASLRQTLTFSGVSLTEKNGIYYLDKIKDQQVVHPIIDDKPTIPGASDSLISVGQIKPVLPVRSYKIKNRTGKYLASVIRFLGGSVSDTLEGEYIIYMADDETDTKITKLLNVVDSSVRSYTISAAVIEFNETKDTSRSFSAALSLLAGKLNVVYKAGNSLVNSFAFKNTTLQSALSAVEGDSRFNYLARPVLRVRDGQNARFVVGSDVAVRSQSVLDKNGNSVQSIQYQTAGLILDLSPVSVGDLVTLKVNQEISSFVQNSSSQIDSPTRLKRQAETTLDINPGELIVMAGLDENKTTDSASGFSWLPGFLKSKTSSGSNSQILLLIEVLPS